MVTASPPRHRHPRRGYVLLVILMITAAMAVLAIGLVERRVARSGFDRAELRAQTFDALEAGAVSHIQAWLRTRADSVVLPYDTTSPRVELLRDEVPVGSKRVQIAIVALDRAGMITAAGARAARGDLAGAPAAARPALRRLDASVERIDGLDQLVAIPSTSPRAIWPRPAASPVRLLGGLATSGFSAVSAIERPSLGEFVDLSPVPPQSINVHTAPRRLLESTLRDRDPGLLDSIRKARESGAVLSPPALEPGDRERTDQQAAVSDRPLSSRSDAWAFRLDLRLNAHVRSAWLVYARQEGADGSWTLVQRLPIDDNPV